MGRGTKRRKLIPINVLKELQICVGLRGYSNMCQRDPMTVRDQRQWMCNFFHGKGNTHPSQIDLLVKGVGPYSYLFDTKTVPVTNKDSTLDTPYKLVLKEKLLPDTSRKYVAGKDFNCSQLEKKSRASKVLITGRNILDMTKRNVSMHRKAMGFASEVWDMDTNTPIKSGTTEADCIEHVRCQMYCFVRKKNA